MIADLPVAEWDEVMAIDLRGPFLMAQACLPAFQRRRSGRMIFLSSITGQRVSSPGYAAYATSKAGILGFMRTAALENYSKPFCIMPFHLPLWNSLKISLISTFGQFLTCSMAAFIFAVVRFPGRQVLVIVLLVTLMMAASLFSVAPIIGAFFLAQRHFVQGIAMSGFK